MIEIDENQYELLNNYKRFVDIQLIECKMNVSQLPSEIRLSSLLRHNYVLAFRGLRSKDNVEEFTKTLIQLDKDIETISPDLSVEKIKKFDDFLLGNMADMINKYEGVDIFDNFMAQQKRKRPLLFETYYRAVNYSYDNK